MTLSLFPLLELSQSDPRSGKTCVKQQEEPNFKGNLLLCGVVKGTWDFECELQLSHRLCDWRQILSPLGAGDSNVLAAVGAGCE